MTVAEQLMRKMCDDKSRAISHEASEAVKKVTWDIAESDLPDDVSHAAKEIRARQKTIKEQKGILSKAGYEINEEGKINRKYGTRDRMESEIRKSSDARTAKIDKLRNTLSIHLMGMDPKTAKVELLKLQKQLDAI